MDQVPIAVEKFSRLEEREDEQFWLVDEMNVQEHPDLAQMVAGPAATKVASRADDGSRLVCPAVHSYRRPVKCVLQWAYSSN